jgi:hypothetical protein
MIIDLATFNINTDQLFQKLIQTREEIARLRLVQRDLQREFVNSNRSVATNQATLDRLNTELQGLTRGTATYNQTLAQRDQAEQQLNESLLEQTRINATYQEQLTANSLELNRLNNQSRSYQGVLDAQNRATNESIDLYSRQRAELTLLQREQRELGVQLAESRRNTGEFSQETRSLVTAYAAASSAANGLATELREIDQAGGNNTSNIANYRSAFDDLRSSLLSGDLAGARNSFDDMGNAIKRMTAQALRFIATPIGAAITALAGIGLAAKSVFDYNEGIKESNQLLKGLGVASGEISKVRTEVEATAETYGKSFEEIAKTADSLASSYGISISEANDIIAKGLAQGGAANEDFLNQISEYDVQFAKLGFTAEESLNLITKGFQQGVQTDKLPDTIKEIGLSLEEMTEPARKALENAFGKEFTDSLSRNVGSGLISTKEAIKLIDEEAKKANLSTQQQAKLTADIFKGAGEDAGGTLKVIELLRETQNRNLTETEQAYEDLRKANKRYNAVQSELFEIENFGSVWANIKAQALNFFVDVIDYVAELKNDLQPLIDIIAIVLVNAFYELKTIVGVAFDFISGGVKNIGVVIGGLVDFVKKVFQGDFKGAINVIGETFNKLSANFQNTFNKIRNTIIDGLKGILSNMKPILEAVGVDVDKLQKKLDGLKGKVIENKTKSFSESANENQSEKKEKAKAEAEAKADKIKAEQDKKNADANAKKLADAQKAKDDAQKKADEAIQKEKDSAQKLADEKVKLANVEVNAYIEKNKSILDNEKFLTSELLKQEQERLRNIEKAKLDQEKLEFDTSNKIFKDKIEAIEKDKTLNQTQLNQLATLKLQQKELELTYNSDVAKIKDETQKQITANETRYSNERIEAEKVRKAIQYQTEILDLEAKGATEQEIKAVQLDQQTQLELDKFIEKQDTLFQAKIEKDQEQRDIQAEIDLIQEELNAELQLAKDENEKIRVQTQLEELKKIKIGYANQDLQIENQVNQNKLKGRTQLLTGLSQLFGAESDMGKALAIANIAQEKASAISSIVSSTAAANLKAVAASPLTAGQPWVTANTVQSGLQIGLLVAQGATSIAQITGYKFAPNLAGLTTSIQGVQTLSGYADGGLISGGLEVSRSNGDNRLITAKDGEVILNERQQMLLGGSDIFRSIGVPGFATGGVVGSPISSLSNIQNQFTNTLNSEMLSESIRKAVLEGSAIGTATGAQKGISDLSNSNIISNGANF